MATAFPDVKPFPTAPQAGPGAPIGHNRPPIQEAVVIDFNEGLDNTEGLRARIAGLLKRGDGVVAKCENAEQAGRYADGAKQISAVLKVIEAEREKHNRPMIEARDALNGAANALKNGLTAVDQKLRTAINAFQQEQRKLELEEQRKADELARQAPEAAQAEAAANPEAPQPVIQVAAAPVQRTEIRGDFGAKAGTTTKWKAQVVKVRQLPDRILNNAKVIEAIEKVLNAEVRGGTREIKGARIWAEELTTIL